MDGANEVSYVWLRAGDDRPHVAVAGVRTPLPLVRADQRIPVSMSKSTRRHAVSRDDHDSWRQSGAERADRRPHAVPPRLQRQAVTAVLPGRGACDHTAGAREDEHDIGRRLGARHADHADGCDRSAHDDPAQPRRRRRRTCGCSKRESRQRERKYSHLLTIALCTFSTVLRCNNRVPSCSSKASATRARSKRSPSAAAGTSTPRASPSCRSGARRRSGGSCIDSAPRDST